MSEVNTSLNANVEANVMLWEMDGKQNYPDGPAAFATMGAFMGLLAGFVNDKKLTTDEVHTALNLAEAAKNEILARITAKQEVVNG